jgi:predicted nucleic acid-binding protein
MRFVIDADAALRIVETGVEPAPAHTLLAPTLLRSQVLDVLYRRVRQGVLTEEAGLGLNQRFAKLKIRYLGDAVLRRRAWALAERAGMDGTANAEYLALTQLQGDALIAEGPGLRGQAGGLVTLAPFEALLT